MKLRIPNHKLKTLRDASGWQKASPQGWLAHVGEFFNAKPSVTGGGKTMAYWLEFASDEEAVAVLLRWL